MMCFGTLYTTQLNAVDTENRGLNTLRLPNIGLKGQGIYGRVPYQSMRTHENRNHL